jgi:hypothetical protein
MSSERIFTDIHLPGGPRLATNPSNTEEENRALDELFSELADVAGERDIYYNLLKVREEEIAEANERLRAFAREMGGQGYDKHGKNRNTESMNEITREEFNAKIETIEAKMDARVESVSSKIEGFLSAQAERDKAQLERDKRYELLADRVTTAAEGAEEAAKQAATVKSNYWAAVGVQLVAVAAILVGAYFATQANTLSAIATTLSAFQAGKAELNTAPPAPPSQQPTNK